ncbi:MAG: hypothetical protein ACFFCT_14990 [Candidatus Odinarchaeota archaeon]
MRDLERVATVVPLVCTVLLISCLVVNPVSSTPLNDDISLEGPNNLWVETYDSLLDPEFISISRTDLGYIIVGTSDNRDGIVIHVDTEGAILFKTQLGNDSTNLIRSVVQCQNGDFVTVGITYNQTSVGTWLVRLAHNGSVLWEKWYEDAEADMSVVECQDGSFIMAGWKPHLLHVDANGSVLWSASYEDWDISEAWDVVECNVGGFAFTGVADINPTSEIDYRAWLVRTDSNGSMLWNQTYGEATLNTGRSLVQCSDGGFAIAGESGAWLYFPRSPWLVRTDENGALLWSRTYSSGYAYSVVQCSDGGFGIAGTAAESGAYVTWDGLFVRTDDEGNELWRSTCSGPSEDRACSLVLSDDGGFAVAGRTLQDSSLLAFLWLLSDDYVPPTSTTPFTMDDLDMITIILAGSAISGIFIVAIIIYGRRKKSH